ncbi:MAG: glycosyltransferase family 2 protein [Flavisolibacter sp.]
MDLSVIIINFRTFNLTIDCIKSIHNNSQGLSFEIILVDNAPLENDEKRFLEIFPDIIYIWSKENIGFGRGNNLGMEVARGKYFLLINSDTLMIDNCSGKCFEFMERDTLNEIGAIGCKLLNPDKTYQPSFYPFLKNSIVYYLITNNILLYKIFKVQKRYKEVNEVREVGDISGAFMFLRKDIIDRVKGFDPDFFLYCEETEWCRERISKKYKIVYFPLASIIHFGGGSATAKSMYIQSKLSLSLLWYKKGWISYLLYVFCSYFNIMMNLVFIPFVNQTTRKFITTDAKCYITLLPYLFNEVIKYPRFFGNRKQPLIYRGIKSMLFLN